MSKRPEENPQPQNYLSIPEVAKLLGISRIAVYKKVKNGQIKAAKIGRRFVIPHSQLETEFFRPAASLINENDYLSIPDAADKLGISRIALYQKIKKGKVPAKKIGGEYVIHKNDLLEPIPVREEEKPVAEPAILPSEAPKQYHSIMELARLLGLSRFTVYQKIKTGAIPATRVGRHYVIEKDFFSTQTVDFHSQEERTEQNKDYISVPEFARILGISRIAVFKRIRKGKIKAIKIGRSYAIERSELGPFLLNKK